MLVVSSEQYGLPLIGDTHMEPWIQSGSIMLLPWQALNASAAWIVRLTGRAILHLPVRFKQQYWFY